MSKLKTLCAELDYKKYLAIDDVPESLSHLELGYYVVPTLPLYNAYITDYDKDGYQLMIPVDVNKPELGLKKIHDLKQGDQVRLFRTWKDDNGRLQAQQTLLPLVDDAKLFKGMILNTFELWDDELK